MDRHCCVRKGVATKDIMLCELHFMFAVMKWRNDYHSTDDLVHSIRASMEAIPMFQNTYRSMMATTRHLNRLHSTCLPLLCLWARVNVVHHSPGNMKGAATQHHTF